MAILAIGKSSQRTLDHLPPCHYRDGAISEPTSYAVLQIDWGNKLEVARTGCGGRAIKLSRRVWLELMLSLGLSSGKAWC